MKVIFTQDVRNVAKRGEIKEVSEGYARNFLFPKNLAKAATAGLVKSAELAAAKKEEELKTLIATAKKTAESLREVTVEVTMKAKDGKLFGSIAAKDIAAALRRDGVFVDEKAIALKKHLKTEGVHEVDLDFGHGVKGKFRVKIRGVL